MTQSGSADEKIPRAALGRVAWTGGVVGEGKDHREFVPIHARDVSGLHQRLRSGNAAGNQQMYFCDYQEIKPRDLTLHPGSRVM